MIRELIDTESNYLDVLNALKVKFMAPLERYLKPDEIRRIFPRIKVNFNCNRFINELKLMYSSEIAGIGRYTYSILRQTT